MGIGKMLTIAILALICVNSEEFEVPAAQCGYETESLCVNQVAEHGFGDLTNQYAWSMAVFQDSLYVATLNGNYGVPVGIFVAAKPMPTEGTNIYRGNQLGNSNNWQWDQVLADGNGNKWNYGVRKLIVVGDYMYGVTGNIMNGFELWRTDNGDDWEVVRDGGFGDADNDSGRGLTTFNGYLYVGAENRNIGAQIFRRAIDTETGDFLLGSDWEHITNDGFGDDTNFAFSDFVEYNGYLYAGTWNNLKGMGLYRSNDGVSWDMLFDGGLDNPINTGVMKLYVYREKLYFGSMNFVHGCSLYVNTDDDGTVFESLFTNGNGNKRNKYVWYILEFKDRFYYGTYKMLGEFDLMSKEDPMDSDEEWITESNDGFGNDHQYGVRTMAIYEDTLMIGTATSSQYEAYGCLVFQTDTHN